MSVSRKADADLQEDVNRMILDFLVYNAVQVLLLHMRKLARTVHETQLGTIDSYSEVALADGFYPIYTTLHQGCISSETQFRIRLLKFARVLARRHTITSDGFAASPVKVGKLLGLQDVDRSEFDLDHFRKFMRRRWRNSSGSLLCLLPSFMALSAYQLAFQGGDAEITEAWMHLAGDFMLHAAFEHAVIFSLDQREVRETAFEWGFDWNIAAQEGSDEFLVNAMFFDGESEGTNRTWMSIREQCETKLEPPIGTNFQDHSETQYRMALSSRGFEERLLVFLENLSTGLSPPLLSQVELGQLERLEEPEARKFLKTIAHCP